MRPAAVVPLVLEYLMRNIHSCQGRSAVLLLTRSPSGMKPAVLELGLVTKYDDQEGCFLQTQHENQSISWMLMTLCFATRCSASAWLVADIQGQNSIYVSSSTLFLTSTENDVK